MWSVAEQVIKVCDEQVHIVWYPKDVPVIFLWKCTLACQMTIKLTWVLILHQPYETPVQKCRLKRVVPGPGSRVSCGSKVYTFTCWWLNNRSMSAIPSFERAR
jgi:hypothetical protein